MTPADMLAYLLTLPASEFLTIRAAVRLLARTGLDTLTAAEIIVASHRTKRAGDMRTRFTGTR
jgi:hypothetical protein